MNFFVYDIETRVPVDEVEGGWDNPAGMEMGTCVVYDYASHSYMFFEHGEEEKIINMFKDNTVISFNGVRFDNKVLLGNNNYLESKRLWKDIDILELVIQSKFNCILVEEAIEKYGPRAVFDGTLGLQGIAESTLGLSKNGQGKLAPLQIRDGKWKEVYQYNLQDVRITRFLFEFMRKYKFLLDRNGNKIPIYL